MVMSCRNHGSHVRVTWSHWGVSAVFERPRTPWNLLSRKVNMLDSIKITGPYENKSTVTLSVENSGEFDSERRRNGEEIRYQEISRPLSREKCNRGGQEHKSQDMSLLILSIPHEEHVWVLDAKLHVWPECFCTSSRIHLRRRNQA